MPTNFEPQSKLLRTLVLSEKKQAAWNGALDATALTRVQRFDGAATIDFNPGRRSDKEYSGKGSWFATNGQITDIELKLSGLKSELTPWLAGWLFAFGMGKETVTGGADDAPYVHTCTFDQSTRQAVPTSVYVKDTDDLAYTLIDMALNDFTLTITDKGAVMADYNLVGTGRYTQGALADAPTVPSEDYLLGSDADFLWGNVGAATSILGRHTSTTFKIDHQLIPHRATGIGLNAAFIRKGDPKFSFQSTIAAKDTDDVFTRMINNTQTAISIAINSGDSAKLTLNVPAVNLKTTKMGFDGDMTIWNVEFDETTCYQAAGVQPVTAIITNDVAAYLTTA
jgi:hypothetical protein